ncbi:MAG: murein L,D-transpeptidase catalytic domain family protein [Bacteroidales bacterium]|nr:murein L,D-transpeptidase catalytic domain family protein [Bacteroidales bacterium]
MYLTALLPVFKIGQDQLPFTTKEREANIPDIDLLYQRLNDPELPLAAFRSSMKVHRILVGKEQIINKNVITIIDFDKPSYHDRLFIIDLAIEKIIYKSLVAHGKNSGEVYAINFSNDFHSHQSSLGYYLTGKTYMGQHGYSLILDGLEKGINDNAKKRSVVIHGATYVSHTYIESYGRLGRSFGCPALPVNLVNNIIDKIRGKSLLFIYSSNENYCRDSSLFKSFLSNP